tara:strand:+ start:972 stop:1478 length:507 start_codon:yes stop_codon:yes gene_type:complete
MNIFGTYSRNFLSLFKKKENLIGIILILIIFLLDRFSKIKIINYFSNNNEVFINDYINLNLVWNTGIGFGLLSSDSNLFYTSISLLIFTIIIFLFYIFFKSNLVDKFLFSLVLGGAIGNFWDRVFFFAVPDFIDIHYENFHWFTFNIADIFISVGIITIILKDLILKK